MTIFDIDKDELVKLSDSQLEELIARLAEAEVSNHGHSPACVNWSGSINAPDAGIDVQVKAPVTELDTGFLKRPNTIFQAKKHSMPKRLIIEEMVTDGKLSATLSEHASVAGSYIIVSLNDDCSPPMKSARFKAMQDATENDPNNKSIHLDFYDRAKLAQWLRQHPSVLLWVKSKLGKGYSGWQPYGAWSNPPKGVDDTLIEAPGVTVTLPSGGGKRLEIVDAIDPMRQLIHSTKKSIRITGLSGVGKTRIVQALFDETVGAKALNRTFAVYVDMGAEPDPSATEMLDRLISEGRDAVMVLDNCPSELHSMLTKKLSASNSKVKLITVEYDIKDDKPQTTDVINIEAVGTEIAERLLNRRFPSIGTNNAHRIAEFAHGNARVSLAIAERVAEGESLVQLSDEQLFNRLFVQRKNPDRGLREKAETLSLVYSFSTSNTGNTENELEILGSISDFSRRELFRATKMLSDRHIVQKRAYWRAILPHAIATRLAASALESIPIDILRETFEAPGRERLLMSFAHRLSLLHDHPVAKEIVKSWLQSDGMLGQVFELDDIKARMLEYVTPVSPEALLDRVEDELTESHVNNTELRYSPNLTSIIKLLQLSAYESKDFDRCMRLLIELEEQSQSEQNKHTSFTNITGFFQAYLSGTHASINQRITIMNECLFSHLAKRRSLGFLMLSTGLGGPPWTRVTTNEFGSRPRDFGAEPNHYELIEWRNAFIEIAVQLGNSGKPELEIQARQILADKFRTLWNHKAVREKLIHAAHTLHEHHQWPEGWKAVRSTIYFDYNKQSNDFNAKPLPKDLHNLMSYLQVSGLIPTIMTYVLGKNNDYWSLDENFDHNCTNSYRESQKRLEAKAIQLGEEFASSHHDLDELYPNLFSNDSMPFRFAFGRGLARGANHLLSDWDKLVEHFEQQITNNKNFSILMGFIEEVDFAAPELAQVLLDKSAQHPELKTFLVGLHPSREFSETDLNRCMMILDHSDVDPQIYEPILWREQYASLPRKRILELAEMLLDRKSGDNVILHALSMRLHGTKPNEDTLGSDFRLLGLKAAIKRLMRAYNEHRDTIDYEMSCVINSCLLFDGNDNDKIDWIDTIFHVVDKSYGYFHGYERTIETTATLMPVMFLNRIFDCPEEEQNQRLLYIGNRGLRRSPIAQIEEKTLIEWCRARNENNVWLSVATGIHLWSKDSEDSEVRITESAIRFIEACPDPKGVIYAFANRVTPLSWSGRRTRIMQLRADAIDKLCEHENTNISIAAISVSKELKNKISQERAREQKEDELHEQRFE